MDLGDSRTDMFSILMNMPMVESDRVLESGFFVNGFDHFDGVVVMKTAEHPESFRGEFAEFQCDRCYKVEEGHHVRCWSVDAGQQVSALICTLCAYENIDPEKFLGLTEAAVNALLMILDQNPATVPSESPVLPVDEDLGCSFGDEEVHAHAISFPASARYKELTAVELHGAWLVCSLSGCALVIPDEQLHSADDSIEFLTALAIRVRESADQFMECSEWIELVKKLGGNSLSVSKEASYTYVMSIGSAAAYLIDKQLASSSKNTDWVVV